MNLVYFPLHNMKWFIFIGDLLVTLARKSDTGLYSCEVINTEGIDMASSQVIVRGTKDNNKNSIIGEITLNDIN